MQTLHEVAASGLWAAASLGASCAGSCGAAWCIGFGGAVDAGRRRGRYRNHERAPSLVGRVAAEHNLKAVTVKVVNQFGGVFAI